MSRKVSSPEMASLAAEVLKDPNSTDREKRLAGSVLSQDEAQHQGIRTEAEVRAMFPDAEIEFNALGHGRRGISALWGDDKNKMRQSVAIPSGAEGLGRAAGILRDIVDAHKGA